MCARVRQARGGGSMNAKTENQLKIESMKKSGKPKRIREKLLSELETAGNKKEYYTDLVEDYITLWTAKELLKIDIEERGVRLAYDNGGGQRGIKKNESVEQLVKVNAQMLKLLRELGITPQTEYGSEEEDEL